MGRNDLRFRTVTTGFLVSALLLAACATALAVKGSGDRAAQNEATVLRTLAEVRLQDSLEWRAISGMGDQDLDARHSASVASAVSLLGEAALDQATRTRLLAELHTYSDAVQRELELLAAGQPDEAQAWDEAHVDPAAETLLEDLEAVAVRMGSASRSASQWTNVGLVGILVLALGLMGLLQRRRYSEQARLEQELRSEARYRAIIDRASDLILVCSREGEESYLSPAADRVLSEACSDRRLTLLDVLGADDQEKLRELLAQAVAAEEAGPTDLRLRQLGAPGGSQVYQFMARDLSDDPSVGGIVLSGQNVTLSRELTQAKAEFLANVSHELRTPLTSMAIYLDLLLADDYGTLHEKLRPPLAAIERNSRRLHLLVEELLFVSGFHSSPPESERESIDLAQIAADVVADARVSHPGRRIDLDLPTSGTHVSVLGIRDDVERVVTNLLTNAINFSPQGKPVAVALSAHHETAEIVVSDHGIGIPLDEQHRLFERFFRSSTARRDAIPGTGLGLAVCKAVVDAHGGSIVVDSAVGRGTDVVVGLPLAARHPIGGSGPGATRP